MRTTTSAATSPITSWAGWPSSSAATGTTRTSAWPTAPPTATSPGRKIWIWGLSREGMIWEDLLTDTDGQYVEVQSGRLFNQADSSSTLTPFKHTEFPPYATDTWTEHWLPVKGIKGFVSASPWGALNVTREGDRLVIRISPARPLRDKLEVFDGDRLLASAGAEPQAHAAGRGDRAARRPAQSAPRVRRRGQAPIRRREMTTFSAGPPPRRPALIGTPSTAFTSRARKTPAQRSYAKAAENVRVVPEAGHQLPPGPGGDGRAGQPPRRPRRRARLRPPRAEH